MGQIGQSELDDIFVSIVKAKELMMMSTIFAFLHRKIKMMIS